MPECVKEAQEFNWSLKTIILWLSIWMIIIFPLVSAGVYLISLDLELDLDNKSLTLLQTLTTNLVFSCALLISTLYALHINHIPFHKFGICLRGNLKTLSFCWALGAISNLLFVHLQFVLFESVPETPATFVKTHWPIALTTQLVSVGLLTPFIEEVLYRGILLRSLVHRITVNSAVMLNTAVFILAHAWAFTSISILEIIGIAFVGCILCIIYLKTCNLINAILFHIAWNTTGTLQTYLYYNL